MRLGTLFHSFNRAGFTEGQEAEQSAPKPQIVYGMDLGATPVAAEEEDEELQLESSGVRIVEQGQRVCLYSFHHIKLNPTTPNNTVINAFATELGSKLGSGKHDRHAYLPPPPLHFARMLDASNLQQPDFHVHIPTSDYR